MKNILELYGLFYQHFVVRMIDADDVDVDVVFDARMGAVIRGGLQCANTSILSPLRRVWEKGVGLVGVGTPIMNGINSHIQ